MECSRTYYGGKGDIPEDVKSVRVADGVTSIPERAFQGCQFLEEVSGCKDVKEVGDRAFIYCPRLSRVSFPSELETFGFFAFFGCTELQRLANSKEQRDLVSYLKHGKKFRELVEENEPLSVPESSKSRIDSARSRGRRKSSVLDDFNNNFEFSEMARQYASSVHEVVSESESPSTDEEQKKDGESCSGSDHDDYDDDLEVLDGPERLTDGTITLVLDETAVESGARTLNHSQVRECGERSDELRRHVRRTSTCKAEDIPICNVAAANFFAVSNAMNNPSFATRFARRSRL